MLHGTQVSKLNYSPSQRLKRPFAKATGKKISQTFKACFGFGHFLGRLANDELLL